MWTYQVRPRHFRVEGGKIDFPTEVTLRVALEPLQPFGVDTDQSRTKPRNSDVSVELDLNTGRFQFEPKELFDPLDVAFDDDPYQVEITGNVVSVTFRCPAAGDLERMARILYFQIPLLLNLEYADPPYPVRVDGNVGDTALKWLLGHRQATFGVATKESQEEGFERAWKRLNVVGNLENRRLLAASRYFYTACRLERAGNTPWEFMGEIILNLEKVLRVLFPGREGLESMDAAREGLRDFDYEKEVIERNFIPVLALRNHIDSGHALLSVFGREDLTVLHQYCEDALPNFRQLLDGVFSKVEAGSWRPESYTDPTPRDKAKEIVRRMHEHQSAE